MKLLLVSALLLVLSTFSADGSAVLDVTGNMVKSGTPYYITSAIWGAGGGGLFPLFRPRICTRCRWCCPLNVAQKSSDRDYGFPVSMTPSPPVFVFVFVFVQTNSTSQPPSKTLLLLRHRLSGQMEQPLLSGEESRISYQHLGRSASVHVQPPVYSSAGVSAEEVRSASLYPTISSLDSPSPQDQVLTCEGGYGGGPLGYPSKEFGRQILDEVEIRQLLIDHVGHHICWGSQPARRWKISAIEDCNVYIGTLETFIEEREITRVTGPYSGGDIDGNGKDPEVGLWELDLRSEFPFLFAPHKVTRVTVPHSETMERCSGCEGRGDIPCPTCNAGQEPGTYKENQLSQCTSCYGRGLIAHKDGSDTICSKCNGKGMLPCGTCGSRGLVKCQTCDGQGSLLTRNIALVKWSTLSNRKVCATSGAASVPEEVFHKARGVQLCNTQAYQCTPAYFADSYHLNMFSSEVIAERSPVPPSARVICERHIISVVPVTRVTMSHYNRSFSFYIVGFGREVFIRDYPARFCWGLCRCFEWLRM